MSTPKKKTTQKKKSIATRIFGEKDPDFKRPAPVGFMGTALITSPKLMGNGQPRPHKRTGKSR